MAKLTEYWLTDEPATARPQWQIDMACLAATGVFTDVYEFFNPHHEPPGSPKGGQFTHGANSSALQTELLDGLHRRSREFFSRTDRSRTDIPFRLADVEALLAQQPTAVLQQMQHTHITVTSPSLMPGGESEGLAVTRSMSPDNIEIYIRNDLTGWKQSYAVDHEVGHVLHYNDPGRAAEVWKQHTKTWMDDEEWAESYVEFRRGRLSTSGAKALAAYVRTLETREVPIAEAAALVGSGPLPEWNASESAWEGFNPAHEPAGSPKGGQFAHKSPKMPAILYGAIGAAIHDRNKERVRAMEAAYPGVKFSDYTSNVRRPVRGYPAEGEPAAIMPKWKDTTPAPEHVATVAQAIERWGPVEGGTTTPGWSGFVRYNTIKAATGLTYAQVFGAVTAMHDYDPYSVSRSVNRLGHAVYVQVKKGGYRDFSEADFFNPAHEPAGSPIGGRFARATSGAFTPTEERVWTGQQASEASTLSKLEVGARGEALAAHVLAQLHDGAPFGTLNSGRNNAPVDLAGDHSAVEVKTGLASNGKSAQHWRATIGQPGKAETAELRQMTAQQKAAHNLRKGEAILARKQATLAAMSQRAGVPIKSYTVGVIMSPDGRRGDVWVIPGFHLRVGWNTLQAEHAAEYVGTWEITP